MDKFRIEKQFMRKGEMIYRFRNLERPSELITAVERSYMDYKEEFLEGGNECAELDDIIDVDGEEVAIWVDIEAWETYATFINEVE